MRTLARGGLLVACLFPGANALLADDAAVQHQVQIQARAVVAPADRKIVVRQGERLEIHWSSDEDGELHLHGYDIAIPIRAGAATRTVIEAKATGRFPVTSHGFGAQDGRLHGHGALLYLEVHPR